MHRLLHTENRFPAVATLSVRPSLSQCCEFFGGFGSRAAKARFGQNPRRGGRLSSPFHLTHTSGTILESVVDPDETANVCCNVAALSTIERCVVVAIPVYFSINSDLLGQKSAVCIKDLFIYVVSCVHLEAHCVCQREMALGFRAPRAARG